MKGTDFITGGKMNVSVVMLTQFLIFMSAGIWQLKEAFTEPVVQPDPNPDDSFDEVEDY